MRTTTAYFAGIGTVVAAVAGGLGGGLLLGDIMSPQQPKHPSSEVTRLEQRASPQPIQALNGATQPVPYVATTQAAAPVVEPPAQPQPAQQQEAQPRVQQASTQASEPKQPERTPSVPSPAGAAQAAAAAEQTAVRGPEDSLAKAREADLKRDARRAEDRRKAERRQQWTERKKLRPRQDDDLADVEASVREATESRPVFGREQRFESRSPGFFGREPGSGTARVHLLDD
jgi:hypothetical protein